MKERWITDEELDANPGLVEDHVGEAAPRLRPGPYRIEGIDLQPCGGPAAAHRGDRGRRHRHREEGQTTGACTS